MDSNKKLTGQGGSVWVNNELWTDVKSIEFKITGNFDTYTQLGSFGEGNVFTGFSAEGTIVLTKETSRGASLLADSFKTGKMPEIKIVTKVTNAASGESERWCLTDVVFTELGSKLEKGVIEEELPFKFSDYEVLETIN